RKSGLKRVLNDLEEEHNEHLGEPEWEAWYAERRRLIETYLIRPSGFTLTEVENQSMWPTLGTYVRSRTTDESIANHQKFLRSFTHLAWRQYSALSHGAYEAFTGLLGPVPVGAYYMRDFLPHEDRPKVDQSYDLFVSTHIGRAAIVLLCIITELQAYCRFEG